MSKKKQPHNGEAVNISRDNYDAMVSTMLELAFRGPEEEAVIMRAAKAGDITPVTKEISRRRMYAKKQGMVRVKPVHDGDPVAPKRKGTKAKRKSRTSANTQPDAAESIHEVGAAGSDLLAT